MTAVVNVSTPAEVFDAIEGRDTDANACADIAARAVDLSNRWQALAPTEKRAVLLALVERIDIQRESLEIRFLPGRLPAALDDGNGNGNRDRMGAAKDGERRITFTIPARLKRAGMETRLLIDGGESRRKPDHSLHRLLAQAHRYRDMVMHNGGKSMSELAAEAGVGGSYFSRVLRLAFLAPDIVSVILDNDHPVDLTANRLAKDIRLPIAWEDQRALLGIG